MFDPASVRFRGPLTTHVAGFWTALQSQGYPPLSGRNLLQLAAHFSRWLDDRGLGVEHLCEDAVASFLAYRRRRGYANYFSPRALDPLLSYLRGIGVVIRPASVNESPVDRLVREYAAYLGRERCLSASTIRGYTDFAREFARLQFGGKPPRWDRVTPADISDFVLREACHRIRYCKHQITALRSLLRFLHVRGHIAQDLAGCVPAVAGWRLAWLPRALEPAQVARLFEPADHGSAAHRRDAVMVRLMIRLGLRAGDVAALELEDLDWRAGEIVLRGKSKRESRLPLPHDVGQDLAIHLRRRRPSHLTRKVFLRSHAPHRGLTAGGVVTAVRAALRRFGIAQGGAHVLRHTAATEMLRHGASLPEIAHVLRHRHIDTTAIYAKVDFAALGTLVQPWPEGDA